VSRGVRFASLGEKAPAAGLLPLLPFLAESRAPPPDGLGESACLYSNPWLP